MAASKVVARVVEPGDCRYYEQGREFTLGGFTPKGLCDSAYAVLSRDAQTMRYGGRLPWERDGRVLTRCPDPEGALWELRPADESRGEGASQRSEHRPTGDSRQHKEAGRSGKDGSRPPLPFTEATWEMDLCQGRQRNCPFLLASLGDLHGELRGVVEDSGWDGFLKERSGGRILPHQKLTLALAGCPNACTRPQISDIGIVAEMHPTGAGEACDGCGACAEACREGALRVDDRVEVTRDRCVGCGQCARACPSEALATGGVGFRLTAGGRLGRHPALARRLADGLSEGEAASAVRQLLAATMRRLGPGERPADVLRDISDDDLSM